MPSFSQMKHNWDFNNFNPRPANGLCTWSAYVPQSGSTPSPFPRHAHTLTTTATAAGELFLFGGWVHGNASSDLYVFSTRDFSTTPLQTSGEVPTPRAEHGAALIGSSLLICGGTTRLSDQYVLNHHTLDLLDLVSREWTRVVVYGPGPIGRSQHTATVVGSKIFVFGGKTGEKTLNDMWTLDLNSLKSQPVWGSYEPASGNKKPRPRYGHVSVTTEDHIIIFGGHGDRHCYNDTWSFDISTGKWTELKCTGSIPSRRRGHAAVLVDGTVYVFGGFSSGKDHLDDLYALHLSKQRWFKFDNVGPSPYRRRYHAMASEGTLVFVLGGHSEGARSNEISAIHVFDTKDIKYPDPEHNSVNLNEKTTQLVRRSFTRPPTQEQPRHPTSSSLGASGVSRLRNAISTVSVRLASLQINHERNPGPNGQPSGAGGNRKPRCVPEDDASKDSADFHTEFAVPHSSSEGEVTRLELERQLSESLAAQTERDERIAHLTDELALKSALLEQAEADAVEGTIRASLVLREHSDDQRLRQTSLLRQSDVEPVDMQAKLDALDELLLSRDQQIGQYKEELANMRAKLEANESELETVRLRLMGAEDGWAKSEAKADKLHTETAANRVDLNEDRDTCDPKEDMEAESMVSRERNTKSMEEMERRNEG